VRRDTPSFAADSSRVHPRRVRQFNKYSANSSFLERAPLISLLGAFIAVPLVLVKKHSTLVWNNDYAVHPGISSHFLPSSRFPAAVLFRTLAVHQGEIQCA
jgi:hypothetical protein